MDINLKEIYSIQARRAMKELEKNNIKATYVSTSEEARTFIKDMLIEGQNISSGGSVTLQETGIFDLINENSYNYFDRNSKKKEDRIKSVFCDVFFSSANAITEHGEIYCVDGSGNRIAPLINGPEKVVIVVGWNKIVPTLRDAVNRVKTIAAPANCKRLNIDSFCSKHGRCQGFPCHEEHLMSKSPCDNSICSYSTVFSKQVKKDRINVIIIGESLGY